MPDSFSVSYIRDNMRGAPVINGNTPGCLIAALDALLVSGWGAAAPTTVTVASGVATATFASATAWQVHAVIEVSGGTPSAINGKARVATSAGNTLTWATSAADGTYTGSISIKYASAGWEKVFSEGTTKAVYRSTDVTGSRRYYRVDDSGNTSARVRGFAEMTDVDTGTEPFPTDAQISGGGYILKTTSVSSVPVLYLLAADSKSVLISIAAGTFGNAWQANTRGFGDPRPLAPAGDIYSAFLSAGGGSTPSNLDVGALDGSASNSSSAGFTVALRSRSGSVGAVWQRPMPATGLLGALSGACDYLGAAPSAIDGQIKHCQMLLRDQAANEPVRAVVPGVRYIPQSGARAVFETAFALFDGADEFAGRKLAIVYVDETTPSHTAPGVSLIDITGPWR